MTDECPWEETEEIIMYLESYVSGLKEWMVSFKVNAPFEKIDNGRKPEKYTKSTHRHLNAIRFNRVLKEISEIEKLVSSFRAAR